MTRAKDFSAASLAELRAVESICRTGGFAPAAQELGVTGSAVSQQVTRLEAKLGRGLFQRGRGRTIQPTPAGVALAEAYVTAVETLERAVGAMTGDSATLRVSLPRSLAGPWLAVRFGRMARTLPGLSIEVHPDRVPPDLAHVDAAVVVDRRAPAGVRSQLLYEERLTPLCAPGFVARHGLREAPQLAGLPLISHDWGLWTAWFGRAGVTPPPEPSYRLADPGLALETAAEGHGAALGCALVRRTELVGGRLVARSTSRWPPAAAPTSPGPASRATIAPPAPSSTG